MSAGEPERWWRKRRLRVKDLKVNVSTWRGAVFIRFDTASVIHIPEHYLVTLFITPSIEVLCTGSDSSLNMMWEVNHCSRRATENLSECVLTRVDTRNEPRQLGVARLNPVGGPVVYN
ncbi:unnamed protein product [Leuciscus chuanchicus]